MTTLILSNMTAEYEQFKLQFEASVSTKSAWIGTLTTQTSTTIVDFVSALGAYQQGQMIRYLEDLYSETAQSDDAIRSIAQMQGLRMSRRLPSTIPVRMTSPFNVTIGPLTQLLILGQSWFTRNQVTLTANTPQDITLYQGEVHIHEVMGEGQNYQCFVSPEDAFAVSDQDVEVLLNGSRLEKVFGGLWEFKDQKVYADSTDSEGRLRLDFGSNRYGVVPGTNDIVTIRYATTSGADANSSSLIGADVTLAGFAAITGLVLDNPTGGANEQQSITYKNLAAGSFGTFSSAVTRNQYVSSVGVYPGILDAITQAQREINPGALEWMNVIRVAALTNSPWSAQQKRDYLQHLQNVTMYAPRFIWVDPIEVPRDIDIELYCFNSAVLDQVQELARAAIVDLFARKPGILLTNYYQTDLDTCVKKATNGAISYTIVRSPLEPMIVTAPESPVLTISELQGGGGLDSYVYQYGMSSINQQGEEGPPSNWTSIQVVAPGNDMALTLSWQLLPGMTGYKLYGRRSGEIGLIATFDATTTSFVDNGSIVPTGGAPNTIAEVPIRFNSINSLQVTAQVAVRQQRIDGLDISGQAN